MPGGDKENGTESPDAPGWYPDPWSATGDGKRYFDGKRWGAGAHCDRAGYIAGFGEPVAVYAPDNTRLLYATGQVVFDRRDLSFAELPDRSEIMFSESQFNVLDYGAGDLRGLAKLGTQACFPGT
jgi:hypothetical protein